ncbi:CHRNA7 [Branchiostoma lanceolatum]|uniref:CHRNA7 protein n=1 Tax=Branchiostoma lanceolatum TaxID=7740 RepID=A0A8K0EHV3_BRALA|nr:CHRNA7 [Branchiostoma lanceolatum]
MRSMRCLVAVVVLFLGRDVLGVSEESRLITDLLQNYVPKARPVLESETAVTVAIDLSLAQINRVDAKNQQIVTNLWMRLYWKDEYLKWNESAYHDATTIRIPSSDIWTPDIVLYNRIEGDETSDIPNTNAIITSSGDVTWLYPITMLSSCKMNVYTFPYDEQECILQFGSWTYDGFKVNVTNRNAKGDTGSFILNEQWDLVDIVARRNELVYACCPEPYPDVSFYISMRRKSLYYLFYVIGPCAMMTVMGLLVFLMPSDCGEKLSVGITMLLSLVVFAQFIAESLPATSRYIPLIGQFFGISVFIVAISSAITVLVLNIHFRGPKPTPVPKWLRTFVQKVRFVFRQNIRVQALQADKQLNNLSDKNSSVITDRPKTSYGFVEVNLDRQDDNRSSDLSRTYTMMQRKLDEQSVMLKRLVDKVLEKQREELVRDEWQNTAVVIDKLLLGVFLLVLILGSVIIYG